MTTQEQQITAEVWTAAKQFVQANLACPLSAVFVEDGQTQPVTSLGEQTVEISSTVDAQNQYGAMLRNYWHLIMRLTPDGWRLIFFEMTDHPEQITIKPGIATCSHCRGKFAINNSLSGKSISCPICRKSFTFIKTREAVIGCLLILTVIAIIAFIVIRYK